VEPSGTFSPLNDEKRKQKVKGFETNLAVNQVNTIFEYLANA
jgi:hypothetical protein